MSWTLYIQQTGNTSCFSIWQATLVQMQSNFVQYTMKNCRIRKKHVFDVKRAWWQRHYIQITWYLCTSENGLHGLALAFAKNIGSLAVMSMCTVYHIINQSTVYVMQNSIYTKQNINLSYKLSNESIYHQVQSWTILLINMACHGSFIVQILLCYIKIMLVPPLFLSRPPYRMLINDRYRQVNLKEDWISNDSVS